MSLTRSRRNCSTATGSGVSLCATLHKATEEGSSVLWVGQGAEASPIMERTEHNIFHALSLPLPTPELAAAPPRPPTEARLHDADDRGGAAVAACPGGAGGLRRRVLAWHRRVVVRRRSAMAGRLGGRPCGYGKLAGGAGDFGRRLPLLRARPRWPRRLALALRWHVLRRPSHGPVHRAGPASDAPRWLWRGPAAADRRRPYPLDAGPVGLRRPRKPGYDHRVRLHRPGHAVDLPVPGDTGHCPERGHRRPDRGLLLTPERPLCYALLGMTWPIPCD